MGPGHLGVGPGCRSLENRRAAPRRVVEKLAVALQQLIILNPRTVKPRARDPEGGEPDQGIGAAVPIDDLRKRSHLEPVRA